MAGRGEVSQRHLLVQPWQNVGMRAFQAHGNFKPSVALITKPRDRRRYQPRVVFDDDSLKRSDEPGNLRQILTRHVADVEEVAAVVEFDPASRAGGRPARLNVSGRCCHRFTDLSWYHPWRCCRNGRISPEITHRTGEAAFRAAKDHDMGGDSLAGCPNLLFEKAGHGPVTSNLMTGTTSSTDQLGR